MSEISCTRCRSAGEQLSAPPFRSALGDRIYDAICQTCWNEWLKQQTAIINHFALDLSQPQARQLLKQHTENYLFGQAPA